MDNSNQGQNFLFNFADPNGVITVMPGSPRATSSPAQRSPSGTPTEARSTNKRARTTPEMTHAGNRHANPNDLGERMRWPFRSSGATGELQRCGPRLPTKLVFSITPGTPIEYVRGVLSVIPTFQIRGNYWPATGKGVLAYHSHAAAVTTKNMLEKDVSPTGDKFTIRLEDDN